METEGKESKGEERKKGTKPSNIGSISATIWLLYSRAYCISHITLFIPSTHTHTHAIYRIYVD